MRRFMIVLSVLASLLLVQTGQTESVANPPMSKVDMGSLTKITTIVPSIEFNKALDIVAQAEELAFKDFPTKADILSVIAVESMFRNEVTDGSGSCGLMQVNAKANSLDPKLVCTLPMTNMVHGVRILRENYERLGTARKALLAYNAGVGNFLKGNYNEGYHHKFLKWKGKLNVL